MRVHQGDWRKRDAEGGAIFDLTLLWPGLWRMHGAVHSYVAPYLRMRHALGKAAVLAQELGARDLLVRLHNRWDGVPRPQARSPLLLVRIRPQEGKSDYWYVESSDGQTFSGRLHREAAHICAFGLAEKRDDIFVIEHDIRDQPVRGYELKGGVWHRRRLWVPGAVGGKR